MKFSAADNFLTGYFVGRIYFVALRLFFTFPGQIFSFFFLVWAFSQPGIRVNSNKNWSSKELRYLKNNEISLEEKCDRSNIPGKDGKYVQSLMCSPAARWHSTKEAELIDDRESSTISFDVWSEKNQELRSEYNRKKKWEEANPDNPSIMESNHKAPRPVYTEDKGWLPANS